VAAHHFSVIGGVHNNRVLRLAGCFKRPQDSFDGMIDLDGFSIEGVGDPGKTLPLSTLFQSLPVAVLKARIETSVPARRRVRA